MLVGALVVLGVMALGGDQENSDNTDAIGLSGDSSTALPSTSSSTEPAAPATSSSSVPEATATPLDTATPAVDDRATLLTGTWQGTYMCSQGLTGLTLSVDAGADGTARALFDFYAVPENPGLPSGSFTMNGRHTPGRLELVADEWIEQPPNYVTADVSASFGDLGDDVLSGVLVAPTAACSTFELTKIADDLVVIPG